MGRGASAVCRIKLRTCLEKGVGSQMIIVAIAVITVLGRSDEILNF